ncbi:tRNA/rRNA methyltransferase [Proteus myxofaciens]|uniref:Putative tRNA/rRNA methyltransferase n=1 Tax=Proteus myxofaciens ATCC 19692 TaxID=1354337 RepID=A0A198FJV9_9GAMM|nr:tRNA/rRNA methyltransferase [Proteus myxofaciens]OAT24481.1 putative tRNA/rRNA methyltransferase [Proteus myxofaciens ATCC 19692]
MNDSYEGKNGKVKVMYVRSEDNADNKPKKPSRRPENGRSDNNRTNKRDDKNRDNKRGDNKFSRRDERGAGKPSGRDRNETNTSRHNRDSEETSFSPWKTISRPGEDGIKEHDGITGKSQIDPEQLRRQRLEETRIYGENACQAMFKNRPDAIVRAWFLQETTPRFRDALKWMAANRKAYHVVEEEEMVKAARTDHHGGVCFLIKKRMGHDAQTYLKDAPEADCVLALEDVGNPHNVGAIMRSCAHFGIRGVISPDSSVLESGAAVRTAEGGAEYIQGIDADNFAQTLEQFKKAGYTLVTTSSHKGSVPLAKAQLPAKMVLILGQEKEGLSEGTLNQGDMSIYIGGTGHVESLNVSVASGVLLAEWWRQNQG